MGVQLGPQVSKFKVRIVPFHHPQQLLIIEMFFQKRNACGEDHIDHTPQTFPGKCYGGVRKIGLIRLKMRIAAVVKVKERIKKH
jgi:hypothetical protein